MTITPLMPMATAVWLVENTTLTFKQIANFCNLHEIEVQGIADGEVAKGIKAYNPIRSGKTTQYNKLRCRCKRNRKKIEKICSFIKKTR